MQFYNVNFSSEVTLIEALILNIIVISSSSLFANRKEYLVAEPLF